MSTTISKTKQSVSSGLKRSDRRSSGSGSAHTVSVSTTDTGMGPVFLPALAGTSGGVGSARVPAGAPSVQRVGESKKEKQTIAGKVQKLLGGLPLSKLKIVIGEPT